MSFNIYLFALLCGIVVFIIALLSLKSLGSRKQRFLFSAAASVLVCGISLGIWSQMRNTLPELELAAPFKNGESMMQELQQALKQNPNDAKDWFRLGQLYMQSSEFDAAITCFDYSIRLSETPYAGQYAAVATAKYFDESQTITPEVQQFLDKALEMDEYNDTALLLVASDYFLHSEHNKAIEIWTKILDSNRPGIDRAAIIEKINQAKRMSGN
ncbi:tetratricopeptide repeat protein [Vibrio mediterranei]|uniref:TPR domain-containing protein n=1 Tax=Vibrio mediterranei TaxID=689 RepID=UPI0022839153|nr:tetratricopeptide repeat protein [Vibrio mediterranei]MCY9852788.1 hypothetical protein [Vibrio mediterranei]